MARLLNSGSNLRIGQVDPGEIVMLARKDKIGSLSTYHFSNQDAKFLSQRSPFLDADLRPILKCRKESINLSLVIPLLPQNNLCRPVFHNPSD
jgi:hypothetical protein